MFEKKLLNVILEFSPDLLVLAGFMRILGDTFLDKFEKQIINIHPSLLPNFKGIDPHSRVISSGQRQTGATVHQVNSRVDGGRILAQEKIDVNAGDNAKTLSKRVLAIEHKLYPVVIRNLSFGFLSS